MPLRIWGCAVLFVNTPISQNYNPTPGRIKFNVQPATTTNNEINFTLAARRGNKIERECWKNCHFPSRRCKLAKRPISKSFFLDIAFAHMHLSIRNKRGNNADCRQITRDVIYVNARALLAASSPLSKRNASLSIHSLTRLQHFSTRTFCIAAPRVSLRINVYICVLSSSPPITNAI
jgi:hypothetical protein